MKIVSLIPARSGSKGIPDKNICILNKHPLITWSVKASILTTEINRTFISTDSKKYADIGEQEGAIVPFIRPHNISTDTSIDLDFFEHFVKYLDNNNISVDAIVHLRPTTPLRDVRVITKAINLFKKMPAAVSLRSIHEMSESAYKCFELNSNGNLKKLSGTIGNIDDSNRNRQTFPKTYQANGYVDIIRPSSIRNGYLHDDNTIGFETITCQEIDTPEDLDYVRFLANTNPKYGLSLGLT